MSLNQFSIPRRIAGGFALVLTLRRVMAARAAAPAIVAG